MENITNDSVVTINIKYTDSEVNLLINSLVMTCTTQIPTEDNGQWKRPYEKLLKDLKTIKDRSMKLKEEGNTNETSYKAETKIETSPGPCD
jgi:hypothetical protein|tara:strand:- start:456 stop:728 length:273 start_codon:yes stop_codon:yes gene_type:complete